uniref:Uncharacterized protein n=1 Tax=Avena sativa TaxID=4498 RepID=A0ACD5ZS24_AVESA
MLLAATACCFVAQDGGGGGGGGGGLGVALFVLVVLAALVFVTGLLHLLVRFLRWRLRARAAAAAAAAAAAGGTADEGEEEEDSALQRQLQQLFHLHDAGLDQAVIDALPVFLYGEVVVGPAAGSKEPFDCAVCLCEFAGDDRLRLLPLCGHAFHIDCIDTWLLSNSTCPLCRRVLAADLLLDAALDEDWRRHEDAVLPVRLGKFKNTSRAAGPAANSQMAAGGTSGSSSLDARRCYSMGSYQYVVAEASLQVSVHRRNGGGAERMAEEVMANLPAGGGQGKRIGAGSKGDSFSVSKIWQWPRNGKGKLPVLASDDGCSPAVDGALQWPRRSVGES